MTFFEKELLGYLHPALAKRSRFQPLVPPTLSGVTAYSESRCEFAIVVTARSRDRRFFQVSRASTDEDVRRHFPPAFDMLSCARARVTRPVFPSVSSPAFTNIARTFLLSFPRAETIY